MNTVLFDLDGTLLPIDEERFTKIYFGALSRKLAPLGFDPDQLVKAIWAGTKAMVMNDGTQPNCDRFWQKFDELIPSDIPAVRAVCNSFYAVEFHSVKSVMDPAPLSARVVKDLKAKGYTVVLATNPIFPLVAVETRLTWLGLRPSDFALITSYENSRFCKPNPMYYKEILEKIGKTPADCLMVGNNVGEDMCFAELGGKVFLVTDHLENPKALPMEGYPQGSFEDLKRMLDGLTL